MRALSIQLFVVLAAIALLASAPAVAGAATYANQVVSYDTGNNNVVFFGSDPEEEYDNPNAAVTAPDGITGQDAGFPNVLSPFSPAYDLDEIVVIGETGHLTLRFPNKVIVGGGLEIGVISNAGLVDASYPNGTATDPAGTFGFGSGTVEVSNDGVNWFSLGVVDFDMPAMYYTDAGPYDTTAGSSPADFSKPFDPAGGLAAFDGLTYSEIVTLFDGSGGGKWLDLGSTGLGEVEYIRFSVADDLSELNDAVLAIDAVVINSAAVGAPVPEPATLALMGLGGLGLAALRRRK